MTNTEILTKAIQKAIDGGWRVFGDPIMKVAKVFEALAPRGWGEYEVYIGPNGDMPYYICTHSALIFNHDFAKALWGDEEHNAWCDSMGSAHFECTNCGGEVSDITDRCWEYHLQQMVIAEDPIKYLGENLPK